MTDAASRRTLTDVDERSEHAQCGERLEHVDAQLTQRHAAVQGHAHALVLLVLQLQQERSSVWTRASGAPPYRETLMSPPSHSCTKRTRVLF